MQQLSKTIELRGLGQSITATEMVRQGDLAMYKRDDEVYEVFLIKTAEAKKIFDKQYEEREVYPNNEDFGTSAWCFKTLTSAVKKFNMLLEREAAQSNKK